MILHSLRFGLATNSSSSHSIVLFDSSVRLFDDGDYDGTEPRHYGWEDFMLASEEAKRTYLGAMLSSQLSWALGDDIAVPTAAAWAKADPKAIRNVDIDHNSHFMFPREIVDGLSVPTAKITFPSKEFFTELCDYIANNDRIAIIGGNDNDGESKYWKFNPTMILGSAYSDAQIKLGFGTGTCRKDPETGVWTVLNRYSGAKARFSFHEPTGNPKKASRPELVDLKITDKCGMGCEFCYQGSTASGADSTFVSSDISFALAQLGVMEVAIGGGDPLLHPQLVSICRSLHSRGITVCLSTKNSTLLAAHNNGLLSNLKPYVSGIAISVNGPDGTIAEQLDRVRTVKEHSEGRADTVEISVHVAVGTTTLDGFTEIYQFCADNRIPLTILGYKPVGRGANFTPLYQAEDVIGVIERTELSPTISFDTSLASRLLKWVSQNVPSWAYSLLEGETSMYIDLVEKKFGPSSFCDESEMIGFGDIYGTGGLLESAEKNFKEW